MPTKNNVDFVLGLKLTEFFKKTGQVKAEFTKTKGHIEKNPVHFRSKGSKQMLQNLVKMGAAYVGFNVLVRKSIQLSNIQEKADTDLATALKNVNEGTDENIKLLKDQAAAIQGVTVVGDEQSQMLQTMALNMGVAFGKIDEVTRGSIGLAAAFQKAGLSQETAMKGIALAYQGNFEQLQRYIPALRSAKDESEKMTILQEAMTKGFIQATEGAKTNAGQMEQLSNLTGDFQEHIGDLLKDGLIPLVKTGVPILEFLNGMEKESRNAALGALALALVLPKITTGIKAMYASMGPAGWLLLGISAAATAWSIYAANADEAATANNNFNKSSDIVLQHLAKWDKALEDISTKSTETLIGLQGRLFERMAKAQDKGNLRLYDGYKKHYDRVADLIQRRKNLAAEDDSPDSDPVSIIPKEGMQSDIDQVIEQTAFMYDSLSEMRNDFDNMGYQQMEEEYAQRSILLDAHMENVKLHLGEESKEYQSLAAKKWATDQNRETQKNKLMMDGAKATAAIGSQLMGAFQGESETMFNVGKAASIANAVINTYEGASKAVAQYPPPFSYAMAAIQVALGFAQVAKIQSTQFKPKGKALGGDLGAENMLGYSFLPPGEDGLFPGQVGEYVMTRRATQMYRPVLEQMNDRSQRGFATGGLLTDADLDGPASGDSTALIAAKIEDAIITGFSKSSLNLSGTLTAKGRDLKQSYDKTIDLQDTL